MDSIVVGFDGTEPSFVALDWAAQRAGRHPCRVEIVTVHAADLFADETLDIARDDAERRVRDLAPDAEVTSRSASGRMPDALLRAAGEADLLVIGAHRRRPMRSALAGWRPLRTVSRAELPVVVVPDDWTASDGPILVGIDDDDSSSAAVEFAAAEAMAAGVGLTLLHAWQMPAPTMDGAVALLASPIEQKAGHRRILEGVCGQVQNAYPDLKVDWILAGESPSAALLMETRRSSLLALGTHHRGFFAGAFLGSVGQDALVESRIPVCVVPAVSSTG